MRINKPSPNFEGTAKGKSLVLLKFTTIESKA